MPIGVEVRSTSGADSVAGRLSRMSTKTDSLAAGRGPLTRVSRDLSWFDPAPSWRRAADLDVGVARTAPQRPGRSASRWGRRAPCRASSGVDRATLVSLGFEGKAGQTLVFPRRDGADVVAIGAGDGRLSDAELRDAAASFARAVPKHAALATSLHEAGGDAGRVLPRPSWRASCSPATASTR